MFPLLSVDVHKPYMPLESFDLRDFVRKPYIVSIIIGKLLYAVSAWWGCASAADRQRLQALLQRGIRSGLCSSETPNLTELAESVDDTLFQRIMHNPYHVMYHLLSERRELVYNIRPRHHDRQLSIISGQLRKRNLFYLPHVVQRLLLTVLLLFLLASFYSYFNVVQMRSVILCNKRICMYVCQ